MNLVLGSHLTAFRSTFELSSSVPESKAFEYFVNYIIAQDQCPAKVDPTALTTAEDDAGIDGIIFVIDGEIVLSLEDLDGILSRNKREFEAEVIFTQAKTSEKFEKPQITNFGDGVFDFLATTSKLPHGEFLKDKKEMLLSLLEKSSRLKNGRPRFRAYYVATGIYNNEPELRAVLQIGATKIESHGLFHGVIFECIDSNGLMTRISALRAEVTADLPVLGFAAYPIVGGIGEAYVAVVKARDVVDRLLKAADGSLRNFVFEENVRDFLGSENPVNQRIQDTLGDNIQRDRFGILNNGITIISRDVSYRGTVFTIKDFQIVNGCQTSNVLFENEDKLTDSVVLTAKIVEATDPDVIAGIVRATNSQSKVDDASFLSLRPVSRQVEEYFIARHNVRPNEPQLFVERRQGQYRNQEMTQSRIFPLRDIFKATTAFWFDRPELASRYPTEIYRDLPILLEKKNKEIVYFTATMALYRFGLLTAGNRKISTDFWRARWHLLMCLKYIVSDGAPPNINQRKAEDYCNLILDRLNDENGFKLFEKATQIISSLGSFERDTIRSKLYIDKLKAKIRE